VNETIRFYLDQNVHHSVAGALRALGIDVLTAYEANRCGMDDPDQLSFANQNHSVLVTYDTDYLTLHATGIFHAGLFGRRQQST
jgi:predicted nuclease of predicted toxin-antitoxin system